MFVITKFNIMKITLVSIALIASLLVFNCNSAQTPAHASTVNNNTLPANKVNLEKSGETQMEFDKTIHNFNEIPQNTPASATFTITNTGNEPLIVNSVKPACSCSVGKWPKEPIAPGASDEITVTFNAKNAGPFTKAFTVVSNAKEGKTIIKIKGTVKSELGKA